MKTLSTLLAAGTLLASLSTAVAHEEHTLTVYTYDSFTSDWGPGPKLKIEFEKNCDCHLNWVAFEDGVTLFNRLRLEGDNPKADVIVGLDNNLLLEAKKTDLFAASDVGLNRLQLPIPWENQTFIPYDYGQYAFIYDKEKLTNPPKSFKELVERQDISVIYQDPRTSTVGRGMLAWVNAVYPETAETAWKTLAKHTVTVGKGWSETYGAFLKGESDMVLSYNTSPLYHQIHEDKDNYVAATFDEGHIVQIELAAKLKASQQQKLANQFLNFLLSAEAQKTLALHNIMLPVVKTDVNPQFNAFTAAKTLAVPMPDKATAKKQLSVWQNAVSQ